MGAINILVLNYGIQMTKSCISELSEYVRPSSFLAYLSKEKTDLKKQRAMTQHLHYQYHPFFLFKYTLLSKMKCGGTIITCASVNPYIDRPDLLNYSSTKGAIVTFTRALSNQ
jgi:NAD(P)-dependent dehydrogenase (short-subunit alcohol dehydrogenase family)